MKFCRSPLEPPHPGVPDPWTLSRRQQLISPSSLAIGSAAPIPHRTKATSVPPQLRRNCWSFRDWGLIWRSHCLGSSVHRESKGKQRAHSADTSQEWTTVRGFIWWLVLTLQLWPRATAMAGFPHGSQVFFLSGLKNIRRRRFAVAVEGFH